MNGQLLVFYWQRMLHNRIQWKMFGGWQGKNFFRKYWYLGKSFKIVKFLWEFCIDDHKFDFPKIHQYSCFEKMI